MAVLSLPRTTVEYLLAPMTGAPADITGGTVQMALAPAGTEPDDVEWVAADWDPDLTTTARLLYDGTLEPGQYELWTRITDLPEIPVRRHGRIELL